MRPSDDLRHRPEPGGRMRDSLFWQVTLPDERLAVQVYLFVTGTGAAGYNVAVWGPDVLVLEQGGGRVPDSMDFDDFHVGALTIRHGDALRTSSVSVAGDSVRLELAFEGLHEAFSFRDNPDGLPAWFAADRLEQTGRVSGTLSWRASSAGAGAAPASASASASASTSASASASAGESVSLPGRSTTKLSEPTDHTGDDLSLSGRSTTKLSDLGDTTADGDFVSGRSTTKLSEPNDTPSEGLSLLSRSTTKLSEPNDRIGDGAADFGRSTTELSELQDKMGGDGREGDDAWRTAALGPIGHRDHSWGLRDWNAPQHWKWLVAYTPSGRAVNGWIWQARGEWGFAGYVIRDGRVVPVRTIEATTRYSDTMEQERIDAVLHDVDGGTTDLSLDVFAVLHLPDERSGTTVLEGASTATIDGEAGAGQFETLWPTPYFEHLGGTP